MEPTRPDMLGIRDLSGSEHNAVPRDEGPEQRNQGASLILAPQRTIEGTTESEHKLVQKHGLTEG